MIHTDDLDIDQLLADEFDAQAREIRHSATTGLQVRRAARGRLMGDSAAAAVAVLVAGAVSTGLLLHAGGRHELTISSSDTQATPPAAAPVDPAVLRQLKGQESVASKAQRRELQDGTVTRAEYLAAFGRLRSCMKESGFDVLHDHWSEENQVIDTGHSDAADPSYLRCYPKEFMLVDATWQSYRSNFGPDARAMADCLTTRGTTPRGTLGERVKQLAALGLDAYKDCPGVTGAG